jgi:hypothetical protein
MAREPGGGLDESDMMLGSGILKGRKERRNLSCEAKKRKMSVLATGNLVELGKVSVCEIPETRRLRYVRDRRVSTFRCKFVEGHQIWFQLESCMES